MYWLFHSNPNRGGVAKVNREMRERGREGSGGGGGGGGGGGMRAIIIISKSIQIKVVPLYSQVKSGLTRYYVLAPSFPQRKNTGTDTRHRHKTQFLSILLHLHSFHFRHSTPESFIQICVNVHSNNATVLHLGKNFPIWTPHWHRSRIYSLAFLNTW